MWDTADTTGTHLSHDLPCLECGHGMHTYLPCSDSCSCLRGRESAQLGREPHRQRVTVAAAP